MRKQQRIRILGVWFKIEHVDLKEESLCGDCSVSDKLIRIDSSLEGSAYKETLRHEVFHAMLGLSGISELLEGNLEEALCLLVEQLKV